MNEEENKNNNKCYTLINGGTPHQLTSEERIKGGSATKFNALKHGRYADKLSQTYICPSCGTGVHAEKILEQDAILMKLSNNQQVYEEIKQKLVLMNVVIETEPDDRIKFAMLHKYVESLLKIMDMLPDKADEKQEGMVTFKDIIEQMKSFDKKNNEV